LPRRAGRAGTRHWTGHRGPHKQAALARTTLGTGQRHDYSIKIKEGLIMIKCTMAMVSLTLIGMYVPVHAALQNVDFYWRGVDDVTLQMNESVTLSLTDLKPVYESYDLVFQNFNPSGIGIISISPMFGNASYAGQLTPDSWLLHYESVEFAPISDWFCHWEITITGLTPGNYSFDSTNFGGEVPCSLLNINVVPIPSSLILLFSGLSFLLLKRKHKYQYKI
jgi:hypothetical protein